MDEERPKCERTPAGRLRKTSEEVPIPWQVARHRADVFSAGWLLLLLFVTWGYSGASDRVRDVYLFLAAAYVLSAFVVMPSGDRRLSIRVLWPLGAFSLFVILSMVNPSFQVAEIRGQNVLILGGEIAWLPSAAIPHLAFRALVLQLATVLCAWCVMRCVRTAFALEMGFLLVGLNGAMVAVWGGFQKLAVSVDAWDRWANFPNPRFFGPFVYANHWAAFGVLCAGALLTWLAACGRSQGARGAVWRRLVPSAIVAAILIISGILLSGSRSGIVLLVLLAAFGWSDWRTFERSNSPRPTVRRLWQLAAVLAVVWFFAVAAPELAERWRLTLSQVSEARTSEHPNSRFVLYRDTFRMADEKPWFGWGMGSYAHVFRRFNSQHAKDVPGQPFYAEAHSDWLQTIAETGLTGLVCWLALGWGLLRAARNCARQCPPVRPLLAAVCLVVAYALVEFPFTNLAVVFLLWALVFAIVRYGELKAHG